MSPYAYTTIDDHKKACLIRWQTDADRAARLASEAFELYTRINADTARLRTIVAFWHDKTEFAKYIRDMGLQHMVEGYLK